ncbi:MAG: serine acetyltransferase [Dysgonamonadaceae bacterium]|jgi:serine O-acetyltransferase|nr:serine acetyltransferase [Dysgonamonadaceae bacterium]
MSDIQKTVLALTENHFNNYPYIPVRERRLPSPESMSEAIDCLRSVIFPGYYGNPLVNEDSLVYHTGIGLEKVFHLLSQQIYDAMQFQPDSKDSDAPKLREKAKKLTYQFLNTLPKIKRLMSSDVKAVFNNDPAARSYGEVIFCYPAIKAVTNYRIAHELYTLKVPLIPRIITELAHAETGIDIHPGAQIGEYFGIDHGTGIVIGQTAIIGNHVTLYQGVTLGARNFVYNSEGHPVDLPRHPILEDYVTVFSNSSILGRITIGAKTVIGGNIWLTHSVPPNSRILQTKAVRFDLTDGAGI